jgi:hypothetical protein
MKSSNVYTITRMNFLRIFIILYAILANENESMAGFFLKKLM